MKRFLKIVLLSVGIPVLGLAIYVFIIEPAAWYGKTRSKFVRVLTEAKGTNELAQSVGYLGLMMPLTNGGWIAIRYTDLHSGGIRSCAIARDSDGNLFESERHFCGSLRYWPDLKAQVAGEEELRKLTPQYFTNKVSQADWENGMFPSYREMMAVESAPDMMAARQALLKLGFKPLVK